MSWRRNVIREIKNVVVRFCEHFRVLAHENVVKLKYSANFKL